MEPNEQAPGTGNYFQPDETPTPEMNLEPEKVNMFPQTAPVGTIPDELTSTPIPDQNIQPDAEYEPETDPELLRETGEIVNWDAKEYLDNQHNGLWYLGFATIVLGLLAVAFFVMDRAWSFMALIVVAAVALIVYIKRPPRVIHYSLSSEGLYAGETLHAFDDFKAFGVLKDGEHFSVVLIPKKRFSPGVTVYFPENQGESIVDIFGARLPMQDVKLDFIDKIVRKLRI